MEKRKPAALAKSSPLPLDYLKMVREVFSANFDGGLKAFSKLKGAPASFHADGAIYADEVLLGVSLLAEGQLSATSIYASCDFDPKASSPTVEDLLGSCVDAIGSLYAQLLVADDPRQLERLADESLSALENVPFEWASVEVERRKVFLRVDRANPELDQMADDWLEKHDPDFKRRQAEEQAATEKLFVTGPKDAQKPGKKGPLH